MSTSPVAPIRTGPSARRRFLFWAVLGGAAIFGAFILPGVWFLQKFRLADHDVAIEKLIYHTTKAEASLAQGQYAGAETQYRAILRMMQRDLGPEDPHTLTARNNLANALQAQGKNVEAAAEHRAVLAIRERVLGPEHPDVFRSCCNLALSLKDRGKTAEALPFAQRALDGSRRSLGNVHPLTKAAEKLVEELEQGLKVK